MIEFAINMQVEQFGAWIERKYLNWQLENGRGSIRKFSRWLEINPALVIQWMNKKGNMPGPQSVELIGRKFPDVYEFLGAPAPFINGSLREAIEALPPKAQSAFRLDLDAYVIRWLENHGFDVQDDPGDG